MLKGLLKIINSPQSTTSKSLGGYMPGGMNCQWGNAFTWMGWNKTAQLQGGYGNKIVYSYANVIVTKEIEVPLTVYDVIDERLAKQLNTFQFGGDRNKTGAYNLLELKALKERTSHPFIKLIDNPNSFQTGIELMESFWYNYEISGDGYLWARKLTDGRNTGQPAKLYCLPSNLVMPVRQYADMDAPINYYQFTSWWGEVHIIPPEDILHLSKWSPFDPILGGYSPLVPGAKSIATNEANQEAQGRAFVNGSTGIIIHSDVGGKDKEASYDKLTEGQVRSIEATLEKKYAGAVNNQKTHVTNGYVGVVKLGDTLADLKLCEAEEANWRDGGALFGVNPILVGNMKGGTENNVQAAYKALVINNVIPKLRKFDASLRKWIELWYPGQNIIVKCDVKKFTEISPDQKLMKDVYGDADWVDQNEKRALIGDLPEKPEYTGVTLVGGGKKTLDQIKDGNFEDVTANAKLYDYRAGA